jgi:hypothetical protein
VSFPRASVFAIAELLADPVDEGLAADKAETKEYGGDQEKPLETFAAKCHPDVASRHEQAEQQTAEPIYQPTQDPVEWRLAVLAHGRPRRHLARPPARTGNPRGSGVRRNRITLAAFETIEANQTIGHRISSTPLQGQAYLKKSNDTAPNLSPKKSLKSVL